MLLSAEGALDVDVPGRDILAVLDVVDTPLMQECYINLQSPVVNLVILRKIKATRKTKGAIPSVMKVKRQLTANIQIRTVANIMKLERN